MSCYHPLKAFPIGYTNNNKVDYKITSYLVDHVEFINNSWIPSSFSERSGLASRVVRDFIEIPCGQCIGCRLDYSRQWANRCMMEASLYGRDFCYFVTLTYNNICVPRTYYCDSDTGEASEAFTLNKRDVQLFLKRLRKVYEKKFPGRKLRYYLCGEYGGDTYRPHYHLLLFNLELDDLTVYKRSSNFTYYNSKFLDSCWQISDAHRNKVSMGYVVVAPMTWETCAYTARYCMKKVSKDYKEFYERFNLVPEFVLMSRKPGIGREFYDKNKEKIYTYDCINLSTETRGLKFRPPRYFDKLYDLDDPDRLEDIKASRVRVATEASKLKLENTSLSYLDLLSVEERNKSSKTKILFKRGDLNA